MKRPVIHISFNAIGYQDMGLELAIKRQLEKTASEYNIQLAQEGISVLFRELIEKLSIDQKVVILIDEYDQPIFMLPSSMLVLMYIMRLLRTKAG